jgi:hypothetical protein
MGTNAPLHDSMMKALPRLAEAAVATLLSKIVVEKAAGQGARLTTRQQERIQAALRRAIRARQLDRIAIPGFTDRKLRLSLTRDDTAKVTELLNSFEKSLDDVIPKTADETAASILETLRDRWPTQSRRERIDRQAFEGRLEERWHRPVAGLGMVLTITRELAGTLARQYWPVMKPRERIVLDVLLRLHARACQVADEILTLIRAGFADGAMARWRTLHEIAVTTLYIQEKGPAAAGRYVAHDAVETLKAANMLNVHAARLGYKPWPRRSVDAMRRRVEVLKAKFGREFAAPYGWAAERPGEWVDSFAKVEEKVDLEHWRPYYKLASHYVHANPKGILLRLSAYDSDLLLTGPSNFGLADPGQNALISLHQVTSALSIAGGDALKLDSVVALKILARLTKETTSDFVEVQRQIQSEEQRERDRRRRRRLTVRKKGSRGN